MEERSDALSRGTLFAVVAVIALASVTGLAMSNAKAGDTDNEDYVGTRDPGKTIARARTVESAKGTPVSWGVFGYTSDRGMTCVQAGMIRDEEIGAYSGKEFLPYSPRDSVGNCGDLTETLATVGGATYAAQVPASNDFDDQAGVVYGLLSKDVTGVSVTIDKTSERLSVELGGASELGDATQAFIAPLPPGAPLTGITVTFECASGKTTVSKV